MNSDFEGSYEIIELTFNVDRLRGTLAEKDHQGIYYMDPNDQNTHHK